MTSDPVFAIWSTMRNLANLGLVPLFIFVISAQALSFNVNKFGIKRLMPRLIMAAILANLSYYILAFIIDAFNIFGVGLQTLITGVLGSGGLQGNGIYGPGLFTVVAVGFVAVIVNAGAALPWLFNLIGIAFLILVAAVIVLIVRQMIVIVFIFSSPLIFLLMVLDNTRPLYMRLRTIFMQLMFMVILIDLCFLSGKLFGILLTSSIFNNIVNGQGQTNAIAGAIKAVMATFSAILPLVLLPFCFTSAGPFMGGLFIWARGLGTITKGFRNGVAAGIGNSVVGDWATQDIRGGGFWRGTRNLLSRGVVSSADTLTFTRFERSRAEAKARQEIGLARFQAVQGSRLPVLARLPGRIGNFSRQNASERRSAAIKQRATHVGSDLSQAQTLFQHDVLDRNGLAAGSFLAAYVKYKRGGPATITGTRGEYNFKQLTPQQQLGLASLAADSGNVSALMGLRTTPSSGEFQIGLTRAMTLHADKVRANGGAFMLRPELGDQRSARRATASSFGISVQAARAVDASLHSPSTMTAAQRTLIADAQAAVRASTATAEQTEIDAAVTARALTPKMHASLSADNASLRTIVDYHMLNAAFNMTPEKLAALSRDHQEAIAQALTRAAAVDNVFTVAALNAGTPTPQQAEQAREIRALIASGSPDVQPWHIAFDNAVRTKTALPGPANRQDYYLYHMIKTKLGGVNSITSHTASKDFTKALDDAFNSKELSAKMQNAAVSQQIVSAFGRFV